MASDPRPIDRFERLAPWQVMVAALIVGEALTAVIVIAFSLAFRGEIALDYLVTGAVTCLVVATFIVHVVLEHGRRLVRARARTAQALKERDELQEQLLQAQKLEAVGQLAGGVAHDFNNLLGGILGNAVWLQDSLPHELVQGEIAEALADIQAAADRAAVLSDQLLTFSRGAPRETDPVRLSDLVETALRLQRPVLDPGISLVTEISPELFVRGDSGQLEQVLMNLLLNARDAMPDGGEIRIEARPRPAGGEAGLVEVVVSDTGVGMDEEAVRRAYEPFFTRKGAGSGLGLAVVYGIVQGHGGTIELRSEPGRGSTFTLTLPAAAPPAVAEDEGASSGGVDRRLRILLVDDESLFRRATGRVLRRRGHEVDPVPGGPEAVRLVERDPDRFDLVLLDLVMPGWDGERTYAALREAGLNAPVVLMSGFAAERRVARILASGAAAFLRKPLDEEALDEALRLSRSARTAGRDPSPAPD